MAQEELEERVVQRTRELEQANRALLDEVDRRQQAFAALRQTQQRFRAIVESTSEWIWEADLQGRLTYTNPAVEGILGWRPDQLLAHRWCEMMDPDDRAQLLAAMPTEVANRRGWNGVVTRWRHLDGSVRFLESSGGAIVDQDGRVTGFRGVERDVSSREQVESELRAANVAAEEASRAKSQFVANMSHEIRTPLNGIIGMTELALDTDLTAEQREYLELARSSANALLQVVGDVLDFAKIEAGRLELEAIPFSLRRTLEEIVRAQQVVASERGLALDLRVAPEVQDLFNGDALRLRQVLVNLIGNAIKFTESGRVTVTAVAGGVSGDRREVRFAVRDTGVGIPAAAQRAIFDAFRQADGSTTRRFGGSGLGLAICRQLVELMGGRISVDSSPEEGSEFRFNAWFLDASELMNAAQAKVASIATSVSMSRELPLLRVLVAEDHPVNQRHLARLLEKLGHLPTVVPDGRAALAALERRRYHLVLMDLQMPHLDGLAATAALRERESGSGRHTPVVAVTARVMVEDRERCLAAGMDGYLAKPLRARELAAEIARLLPDVTSCQAA
jgi:PAS domain S-box-containing protein